ncbi:MAG: serine hydrolase [Pseudomonadota bacterium]
MKNRIVACLCASFCLAAGPVHAQEQHASERMVAASPVSWAGLWVGESSFGPRLRGPLNLHRSAAGSWIARVQGETVPVGRSTAGNGAIRWSFAFGDQARFTGWQAQPGAIIEGHWLQEPGPVQSQSFATPVRLEPAGAAAFTGEIAPFDQRVSLNIPLIAEGAGDEPGTSRYRTFMRNPERNQGVFFRIETATADGDAIRFANADGEILATGRSVEPGERFTLFFPRFDQVFDFTRRPRSDAPGFYPRRWPEAETQLVQPVSLDDGWGTASPGESGLDEDLLAELVGSIAAFEPTVLREPYIHGLLIAHRGRLVVEEYFHGYHRDVPHDSRSAGKSLTSALLGIAIRQDAIPHVDTPVYPYFGGVEAFANPDPRKERMTLRHLVTMSPGFDCDDGDYDTPGHEDNMQSQDAQADWYRYTLDLPMAREPGETGLYCTAGLNLIGGVLQQATGMQLARFFHEEFARPLDISHYQLNLSPTDDPYMGGGIRLRPRDFLKLGQVYLDGGVWNGTRIVSEEWVAESTAPYASLNEEDDYGFAWWLRSYEVEGQSIDTYYASGNGGQLLFVAPALELVVLIHAGNYSDGRTRNAFRDRFMRDSILPAALAAGPAGG